MARLVDAHCDIALVGDSVGMVLHGLPSTLGVTLDMMILHGKAVRRGLERALMVVDMPFGSYEESPEQAFRNAAEFQFRGKGMEGHPYIELPHPISNLKPDEMKALTLRHVEDVVRQLTA